MVKVTRRAMIATGMAAAGTAVLARAALDGADGEVDLSTLRRPGDTTDGPAFRRAAASGRPIYAPAGRGSGLGGRYVIGSTDRDTLPSGLTLRGDGMDKTVLKIAPHHPFLLHCDSRSPHPARNITALRFADIAFESDVLQRGFSEFEYLVMLNGVTDVRFDRVAFRGFRGDGLHLGASTTSQTERHNRKVVVADCVFDGVNANNRNAISILDCTDLLIENSRFLNCTRTGDGTTAAGDPWNVKTGLGMPGPIDIEPNLDKFAIVRDVTIRNNRFRGGGGFAVALHFLANNFVTTPQFNIRVTGNTIEDRVGGIDMTGYGGNDAMDGGPAYGVVIEDNQVSRCTTPFRLSGARGLVLANNDFVDCADRGELNNNAAIADAEVRGNRFERIGSDVAPFGLWVRDCDRLTIAGNRFLDCGGPKGGGTAIALVAGTPRRLTIADNDFASPRGRMSTPLLVFRDARPNPRAITVRDNRYAEGLPPIERALGL